jgi:hypothetical protein
MLSNGQEVMPMLIHRALDFGPISMYIVIADAL